MIRRWRSADDRARRSSRACRRWPSGTAFQPPRGDDVVIGRDRLLGRLRGLGLSVGTREAEVRVATAPEEAS